MNEAAFQDQIPAMHCFGCGPDNTAGLRIKSYWHDAGQSICRFQPEPHHCSGPKYYLNGGILATIIDCHCICTAVAEAYRREERTIGTGEPVYYVTGSLSIKYLKPVPVDSIVELHASIIETGERKTLLNCIASSKGEDCASAEVVAIKVPPSWNTKP